MPEKNKTRHEIITEMTKIIAGRLESMPAEEQEERLSAFRDSIKGGEKHACNRPKGAQASHSQHGSRRIPA